MILSDQGTLHWSVCVAPRIFSVLDMQQISYWLSPLCYKVTCKSGIELATNRRSLGSIWAAQENRNYNLFAFVFLSVVVGVVSLKSHDTASLLHIWKSSSGLFINKHFIFYLTGLYRKRYLANSMLKAQDLQFSSWSQNTVPLLTCWNERDAGKISKNHKLHSDHNKANSTTQGII